MRYVSGLLAPGEQVLLATRRHWVVLLRWVGPPLVLVLLGLVMAGAFGFFGGYEAAGTAALVGVGLAVVGALVALPGVLRWANELYLVTDRRVIQVEGVFSKHALDSGLAKVNDVRLTQSLWGRMLGYGTLEIITASESGINRFDDLPRPLAFKKAMMSAAHGAPAAGARAPGGVPHDALFSPAAAGGSRRSTAERLAELDELRARGLVSEEEYRATRARILEEV